MIRFLTILSSTLFLFNYEIFAEAGDNLAQTIDTSSDSTLVNTLFFGFALFVSLFGSYFYYKFKTINKQKQHVDEELKRQMLINNHADDYITEMELLNAKFTAVMNIDITAKIIFNRNGDIVIMNKAANQLFDIDSEDVDNLKIWHLYKNFKPDSSSGQLNYEAEFKDLLNSTEDKPLDFHERELIYKNKFISEKIREVEIDEEQLFCVSFEDINNFKIHQKDLVESEKRFREMAEYSPQPFFEFDLSGKITYISNAGYALFYLSKEDLISGLSITDFLIPSDVERAFIDIEKATKERLSFAVEYTLVNKNKTELPAMVFTSPIVRNDVVVGHRGIIYDVSQQKKQLETMQTDADFYNSIISSVPVSLYAKSADDGKYFLWNSAAEKMFGIPAEKIIGKRDIEIFPKEKALNYVKSDKEVCSSGKPVNVPDEKYPGNEGES